MKKIIYFLLFIPIIAIGQSQEANLLGQWNDPEIVVNPTFNNSYSEVWGVVANNNEFAVIGSTGGTHFIDVTDPQNPREVAFVQGVVHGSSITHRDFHDYQCYLYAVSDQGSANALQVIDYSNLPNSVEVVYESQEYFARSHNIFIDTSAARLYVAPARVPNMGTIPLRVLSLENPETPELLADIYEIEGVGINGIHDLYVRENIAYLNLGGQFMVADFTDADAPVYLGGMTSYPQQGYNHSGWLNDNGDTYYMADETHGRDLKVVDVSDFTDIEVVQTFDAESTENSSIPHNLIVRGDYLYVSYYYDGLQVYDIGDPQSPQRIFHYDTYAEPNLTSYRGAWGVFPYLPSGNILISDMQSGLFVFEKIDNTITGEFGTPDTPVNCGNLVNVQNPELPFNDVQISPLPFNNEVNIAFSLSESQNIELSLLDPTGRVVRQLANENFTAGQQRVSYTVSDLPAGMYFLELKGEQQRGIYKVIKL